MKTRRQIAQDIMDRNLPPKQDGDGGRVSLTRDALRLMLMDAIQEHQAGDVMPTFSLHERRLALAVHPDADRASGEVVLVAAFGDGPGILGGHHELCVCMGEQERKRLIEVLQMPPTIET